VSSLVSVSSVASAAKQISKYIKRNLKINVLARSLLGNAAVYAYNEMESLSFCKNVTRLKRNRIMLI
jgi:hypothetical protein